MKRKTKIVAAAILFAALTLLCLSGCSAANEQMPSEDNAQEQNDEALRTETISVYRAALENYMNNQILPNGEDCGLDGEMSDNKFAVYDVDNDGKEELLVANNSSPMAGQTMLICGYDSSTRELTFEFNDFPMLSFYDNGCIKADWSHNQGLGGEFWPYSLYRYDEASDSYLLVGMVDAWDSSITTEGYPADVDISKSGFVYYIMTEGVYDNSSPVDVSEYDEWYASIMDGASTVKIEFFDVTAENIAALS